MCDQTVSAAQVMLNSSDLLDLQRLAAGHFPALESGCTQHCVRRRLIFAAATSVLELERTLER